MPRMRIFNFLEREAFESPPLFDSAERKRFFSSSLMLSNSMTSLRTSTNRVCFLVAAGYFKARRKFFARQFRQKDIEFVARQIGVIPGEVHVEAYSNRQAEGIALAKASGLYKGRKKALSPERVTELKAKLATAKAEGKTQAEVAEEFGISRETLRQYLGRG